MSYDSFTDARAYILKRAIEDPSDVAGDFYAEAGDALTMAWRDLTTRIPILDFIKWPPGAAVTADDVTSLTLTIATAGAGVGATLSAVSATSLLGYKIRPTGKEWLARITAHVAGTNALTLDAAPETIAAGTACTIFQDEVDLASDLGAFVDGLWWQDGSFLECKPPEWLRQHYPDPPDGATVPAYFCRLTRRRIKLSHYPTAVRRFEYPYTYEPADPSGATEVALPTHWRPAWVHSALADLLDMKFDRRDAKADQRAERWIARAIEYENRRWGGLGALSRTHGGGVYAN